jgi:uncharacterized membrane protein YfcA
VNPALLIDLVIGFAIGLTLGLLGGGGSILTVPALVYLVGQSPATAVTTSLAIVGANSLIGAGLHSRRGKLNHRVAVVFGGAGMIVAYAAAGLSRLFTPGALLAAFALLMLVIGGVMLSGATRSTTLKKSDRCNWPLTVAAGAVVGLLTGILGVGGGFLIVPALVMLVGLPMQEAVGTSLLVIAANSLAGLLGHLGGEMPDPALLAVFVFAGLIGIWAGTHLAHRVPAARLQQGFAVFVVAIALFLLADNLPRLLA